MTPREATTSLMILKTGKYFYRKGFYAEASTQYYVCYLESFHQYVKPELLKSAFLVTSAPAGVLVPPGFVCTLWVFVQFDRQDPRIPW